MIFQRLVRHGGWHQSGHLIWLHRRTSTPPKVRDSLENRLPSTPPGPVPTQRPPTGQGGETVMTIVAEKYDYVIGIDTQARTPHLRHHQHPNRQQRSLPKLPRHRPGDEPGHRMDPTQYPRAMHRRSRRNPSLRGDDHARPNRAPGSSSRGETAPKRRPSRPRKI